MKLAIVLFNLGGPDRPEAVRPFLENLFSDPAIINLPAFVRRPLAKFIAARRTPLARGFYDQIGGRSPILPETEAQARALETALVRTGHTAKCFIAMRYWHPMTRETVAAVRSFQPDRIVLLPLYPQYSTTTTRSSLEEWRREAKRQRLTAQAHEVCCYPFEAGFVAALTEMLNDALAHAKPGIEYRVLFSAHGLPKRMIERGDPYQWQVERTVEAILARLTLKDIDYTISYQSRVGPLEWIGPDTDAEVRRAGADGKGLIVIPVAFVSEHSETLYELDIAYGKLARETGVPDYIRVPTARTQRPFIEALASLVGLALGSKGPVSCAPGRICPRDRVCGQDEQGRGAKDA
ncbi:MAG: ferrochelatase [Alphaproteobacteria bacterium]|nr:ferrochelatase [Alphaproteobacteria bacterium]